AVITGRHEGSRMRVVPRVDARAVSGRDGDVPRIGDVPVRAVEINIEGICLIGILVLARDGSDLEPTSHYGGAFFATGFPGRAAITTRPRCHSGDRRTEHQHGCSPGR